MSHGNSNCFILKALLTVLASHCSSHCLLVTHLLVLGTCRYYSFLVLLKHTNLLSYQLILRWFFQLRLTGNIGTPQRLNFQMHVNPNIQLNLQKYFCQHWHVSYSSTSLFQTGQYQWAHSQIKHRSPSLHPALVILLWWVGFLRIKIKWISA